MRRASPKKRPWVPWLRCPIGHCITIATAPRLRTETFFGGCSPHEYPSLVEDCGCQFNRTASGCVVHHAQRHGVEPFVTTGTPPGLIKKVEPAYPMGIRNPRREKAEAFYRLTINPKSGLVDELKIVKSTGGTES